MASPYGREQAAEVVKAIANEIIDSLPGRYVQRGRAKRASSTSSCSTKNCFSQAYSTIYRDSTGKVIGQVNRFVFRTIMLAAVLLLFFNVPVSAVRAHPHPPIAIPLHV